MHQHIRSETLLPIPHTPTPLTYAHRPLHAPFFNLFQRHTSFLNTLYTRPFHSYTPWHYSAPFSISHVSGSGLSARAPHT